MRSRTMSDVIYHEPYITAAGCKVQQRDTIGKDGVVQSTEVLLSVPIIERDITGGYNGKAGQRS